MSVRYLTVLLFPEKIFGLLTGSNRLRKIRCDKDWPICQRCISTGRTCDGYGIWGGGGNTCAERYRSARTEVVAHEPSFRLLGILPSSSIDADEQQHFELFWLRTARKLPGAFYSDDVNAALFQTSISVPAVRHALLALTSVHKYADVYVRYARSSVSTQEETFSLVQYNKAIRHLQQGSLIDRDPSVGMFLVSALLFIFIEYFRGRYRAAELHLEHALKLVSDNEEYLEERALSTFKRLYVQYLLFQRPRFSWSFVDKSTDISELSIFSSTHQARSYLENLLLRTYGFSRTTPISSTGSFSRSSCSLKPSTAIKNDLRSWSRIYDQTMADSRTTKNPYEHLAYRLLQIYHTMAEIMAYTMDEENESRFDCHTPRFVSMLDQILAAKTISSNVALHLGAQDEVSHSIADIGLIGPLYYVALKCRVYRLRLHAIRLLEESPHKEGIWDSTLAAKIATKVMHLEHLTLCTEDSENDSFDLTDVPNESDMEQASVPDACRLQQVEVFISDDPARVELHCRWQASSGGFKVNIR